MNDSGMIAKATVIRENLVVKGGFVGKGNITIAGTVEGNVQTHDDVHVQPKGRVTGDIEASVVTISGEIDGNIKANVKLIINATGQINGDIETPSISIEEGANIIGSMKVSHAPAEKKQTPPAKKKDAKE